MGHHAMNIGARLDESARESSLLLLVAQSRDVDAFRSLFEIFAPRLRAFVGRNAGAALVEDIVQETFVNVWRKANLYNPERASAATWIYTIARNARIDLLRKTFRPEVDANDPALVPEPAEPAFEQISRDQEDVRLKRALSALPAEQHEVLRLAYFADMAHGDIAAHLNLPLGTVKSRIRLALRRIRLEFGEEP